MQSYTPDRVINGTFGEVTIGDDYMAEVTGLEAKVTLEKTEVNQTGSLGKGYKVTGIAGKGTVKFNKITSYFIELTSDNLKNGKTTTCDIISNLEDPDSFGAEKIKLKNCVFDELTLANWEAKKMTEESVPFTFSDWDIMSFVDKTGTEQVVEIGN